MAKATNIRLKVLKLTYGRQHRYRLLRVASQAFSLAVLVSVPLLGIARVDFWHGNHLLLFKPAPFKHALAGVIIGIAAMYVVTFLSNIVAGRLFCGWGCPVGQVSRFGELVDTPGLKLWARVRDHIYGAAYSAVFVVAVLAWWVDLRMLIFADGRALAVGWGLVAFGVAGAYLHGRFWRWEFCKVACPIGWYYSMVAPAQYFGIHFRNQNKTCIECNACDNVCPVDLKPRQLGDPVTDRGGMSLLDAPGFNHCLECGDCVDACERMIQLRTPDQFPHGVPLLMGDFSGPQRAEPDDAKVAVSDAPANAEEQA